MERGTKTKTFKSVRLFSSLRAPAIQNSCSRERTAVAHSGSSSGSSSKSVAPVAKAESASLTEEEENEESTVRGSRK